jgi:uncharacterized protein YrrD
MELKSGADVYGSDDKKLGTIERVVIDPRTKEVTHVVVDKGFFFGEDKVVPISLLGPVTEERVVLREGNYDFEDLPSFRETEYVRAEAETAETREVPPEPQREAAEPSLFVRPYYWYPPLGVGWWNGMGYPSPIESEFVRTVEINIPEGTVALEEGAQVIGSDDEPIGKVDEVMTDAETERVTHFIISEGLIFKEKKLIPAHWVQSILEDRVFLSVPSGVVKDLPDYEEVE